MEKKAEEIVLADNDPKVYEIGFHIVPTVREENLGPEVTAIRDVIDTGKANMIADEYPKHLELAYPMVKVAANKRSIYHSSYFGWMKFEVLPSQVKAITEKLKKNDAILRFIMIKTVRENTMVPKKVLMAKRGEESTAKSEEKVEEKPQLTAEELDKTIEDLVIS